MPTYSACMWTRRVHGQYKHSQASIKGKRLHNKRRPSKTLHVSQNQQPNDFFHHKSGHMFESYSAGFKAEQRTLVLEEYVLHIKSYDHTPLKGIPNTN